jgi:IS5 family transposase
VWIDTERGEEAENHLCHIVELNLMEEEFHAHRTVERRRAIFFARQREMDREEYKDKREEERARKREKARCVKEAYERGGGKALVKGKWACLTQD